MTVFNIPSNASPERRAQLVEEQALANQRALGTREAAIQAGVSLFKDEKTRAIGFALLGFAGLSVACNVLSSSGVEAEATHTPTPDADGDGKPDMTPTHAATNTATHVATLTATPSHAPTELLVAPSVQPTDATDTLTLPDFDLNGDGRVDAVEMGQGVLAMEQWLSHALHEFASGNPESSAMAEKIAHLFGFDQAGLTSEAAVASTSSLIDFPWLPDSSLVGGEVAAAAHLATHDGLGILTTGENLAETMARLSVQVELVGRTLDDPDSSVKDSRSIFNGLTDQLGLENNWLDRNDEVGLRNDMCVAVSVGEGATQSELHIPVIIENGIAVGQEFLDNRGVLHASNHSPLALATRIVDNSELLELQQHWDKNGQRVEVTRISPQHSIAMEVFVADNLKPLTSIGSGEDGGQLVWCPKPEQGGVQSAATPSPSATPSATETQRPGGGGPGPEQATNTPVVPSSTPRPDASNTQVVPSATPRPTDALPPTVTPPAPTETEVPIPTASRTPWPTVTPPTETWTPAPPETPKASLTPLPTNPAGTPTSSAPLFTSFR